MNVCYHSRAVIALPANDIFFKNKMCLENLKICWISSGLEWLSKIRYENVKNNIIDILPKLWINMLTCDMYVLYSKVNLKETLICFLALFNYLSFLQIFLQNSINILKTHQVVFHFAFGEANKYFNGPFLRISHRYF